MYMHEHTLYILLLIDSLFYVYQILLFDCAVQIICAFEYITLYSFLISFSKYYNVYV